MLRNVIDMTHFEQHVTERPRKRILKLPRIGLFRIIYDVYYTIITFYGSPGCRVILIFYRQQFATIVIVNIAVSHTIFYDTYNTRDKSDLKKKHPFLKKIREIATTFSTLVILPD